MTHTCFSCNWKMVRHKVRKKENRKQIDLAKSLSSTSRSTQGWEPTGFQAKVDWISVLTGQEKDWKRSVTLQTSLYCRSLALIEDLSDQFEEREANRREKPASKSGQVEVSLPSSCSIASSELATFFFLVWWRLRRPNFFQRRLSTTIAQRAFQHGLLATRISKRRGFLTCRSSSTGPSNFLATLSLPRYSNPDNNC